jgi:hypothetical protein
MKWPINDQRERQGVDLKEVDQKYMATFGYSGQRVFTLGYLSISTDL